jgi:hypothetical protein
MPVSAICEPVGTLWHPLDKLPGRAQFPEGLEKSGYLADSTATKKLLHDVILGRISNRGAMIIEEGEP